MSDIASQAGVSRQAIYLNFASRTELMIATVQYGDEVNNSRDQIQPWIESEGPEKLDAWIHFWGHYLPQIFGVAKSLMVSKEHDEAAKAAWDDRMTEVRTCCHETIQALSNEALLASPWKIKHATEALWAMLSISNYELLTVDSNWSTKQYVQRMQIMARATFVAREVNLRR